MTKALQGNPYAAAVEVKTLDEYQSGGYRLFLSDDKTVGFALASNGDIVSVFKGKPTAGNRLSVYATLALAIEQGGTRLDCFDTKLPHLYSKMGFVARSRTPFVDQFAPANWDYNLFRKFNNGRPDVVFMAYDANADTLYEQGQGELFDDYGEALQARDAGLDGEQQTGEQPLFSIREEPPPQKTGIGYKLFKVKKSFPGKLFPTQVDTTKPFETGVWIDAEFGDNKKARLAPRPGLHLGDAPTAKHMGAKDPARPDKNTPSFRAANEVWGEVEYAADVDWQAEADRRATTFKTGPNKGKANPATAEIRDEIPVNGFYRYKTNPAMEGQWIITGAMRIKRLLTDEEVVQINERMGTSDLPRQ